jgi:hypothetical protein
MFKIKSFKTLDFLIIASLFLGLSFAIKGLVSKDSLGFFVKNWESVLRNVFLAITALFVLGLVSRINKIHPLVISLISVIGITVLSNNTWPFVVVLWFVLSSYILGSEAYKFFLNGKQDLFFVSSILLGAGTFGTVVSFLAHYPINYPAVYSGLLSLPILLYREKIPIIYAELKTKLKTKIDTTWHDYLISSLLITYYLLALMPEIGHDALAMHLFIPTQTHENHQWNFNFHNYVWAVMPTLVDFIYTLVVMLSSETGARIVNFVAIFLIAYLVYHLGEKFSRDRISAKIACLLFLSTPLIFLEGSTLFIDAVWTLFVLLAFYEALNYSKREENKTSIFPILLGFALAAKSVTFTYVPGLIIILILRCKKSLGKFSTIKILLTSFTGLFLGMIPYIRSYYYTGNPIFPFFNSIFKSEYFPLSDFDNYSHGLTLNFLYEVTFNTHKYLESGFAGSGFYWIFLFIPGSLYLISNFKENKSMFYTFIFALIGLVLTFQGSAYLRYILPSYALLCTSFLPAKFLDLRTKKIVYIFVVLVIILNLIFIKSATNYGAIDLPTIFNKDKRSDYLSSSLPIRNQINVINDLNVEKAPVLFLSHPLAAGLKADAIYPNWYNIRAQNSMQKIQSKKEMLQFFLKENISFVLIDDYWDTNAFDIKAQKLLINEITNKILDHKNIQIRKIKEEFKFIHENIRNGNLNTLADWQSDKFYTTSNADNSVLADVNHSLTQSIDAIGNKIYRVDLITSCNAKLTQLRAQINWYDLRGAFIDTSISVFDCSYHKSSRQFDFISPSNAKSGVVYLTGHTNIPIKFYSISVRD